MALALVVLWGLRPWQDNSELPPPVPLGIEMAVGGGRALPAAQLATVADGIALPVTPKPAVKAAARAGGDAKAAPPQAIAPAQAVAFAEAPPGPAPESGAGGEVPSVGATDVEAPTEGTSPPVTTPTSTGGGVPGGPVTAGVEPELESCEGDEYRLTITFLGEGSVGSEPRVDIVLERLDEDGSVDELQLEGDLSDARSLASTLGSEGDCVEVVIAPPEEEGAEPGEGAEEVPGEGEEVPGASEEVAVPAESLEPVSP